MVAIPGMRCILRMLMALALCSSTAATAAAVEDGYDLWLRYRPVVGTMRADLAAHSRTIVFAGPRSPTAQVAVDELQRALTGMLGRAAPLSERIADGALVLATPASMPPLAAVDLHLQLDTLGKEGYLLRTLRLQGHPVTLIAANTDIGLLYGAYAWLRAVGTNTALTTLDQRSVPALQLRVLDHWDNPDRHVERGYAGPSIWNWADLPAMRDPRDRARYRDYARANASLGINGAVLNNVNASADILTAPWIAKVAALADTLRPYGIKVYLSAKFSSPVILGATTTADPLDPAVAEWWRRKADEIYRSIPDFGGFLVKANSEGQPGPQDYHRSHADGANMLAAALQPHGGVVMWRAFVYAPDDPSDRAKQAYSEFKPLDGKFAANVLLQVKNGAIDFQPREPFHPLFGAMPHSALMMEFQVTKEYLGFNTHLAYLGTLFEEALRSDTGSAGQGSTVARILEQSRMTGMAGVANIGSDRNWSGSDFDQANWYAFGRLAWNPQDSAERIAREWIAQTFSGRKEVIDAISAIMLPSREAVVNYMTPLGLHHLMGTGHHYGPAPWVNDLERPDWNPAYYHQADRRGIGFARGAQGSNALAQYAPAIAAQYADPNSTPEQYLLWFHHLPWDYRMPSGRTLWVDLLAHYDHGVQSVVQMQQRWAALKPQIDPQRHAAVAANLAVQLAEAIWWRDACIAYFQSVSGLPLPAGVKMPAFPLDHYKALRFPNAPGRG
jgi:alpha-glucuronidase